MKKTVIINRGIPASGKSTLSNKIVKKLQEKNIQAKVFSTDEFFYQDGIYVFEAEKLKEYHEKNIQRFEEALKQNIKVVICDNTNLEAWEANIYFDLAKKYNYRVFLVDFKPRDLESHFQAQKAYGYERKIPKKILEDMLQKYKENYKFLDKNIKKKFKNDEEKKKKIYKYDKLYKIDSKKDICILYKKLREKEKRIIKSLSFENQQKIIKYLKENGATKSDTPELYEAIGKKSYRALEDAFKYLESIGIVKRKKDGKAYVWELFDKEYLSKHLTSDDYINLQYAIKLNKEEFSEQTYTSLKKIFKTNQDYMMGHLAFYEEFKEKKFITFFEDLIKAIKKRYYLRLRFNHDKIGLYENVKPYKLLFVDNNWYITFEYQNGKEKNFVIRRIAFLDELIYLKDFKYSNKNTFQKKELEQYEIFVKNIQNSMTLYGVEKKIAKLKATPNIARYFKKGMKKFLSSQEFLEELEDGSVIFSLEYTQELEIMPFIQKWLPDLVILEPKELQQHYKEKLQTALQYY